MRCSGWSTGVVGAYSPFILHSAHRGDGRHEAQRRALAMTATLGVLERAAVRNLIDLPRALARLQTAAFRTRPELF